MAAVAPIAAATTLLCLTVELPVPAGGTEQRQVVSGLAVDYTAAELLARSVLVVCNVAPRELVGLRSEAGLLVAYFGSPERRELVSRTAL